mmetsp:Transcript_29675/g.94959  ORF Transcript_29675/g.94959 Transcript_29675/m.94959 type:complete len:380 (-) Transcript_29675:19-1158(-)
MRSLSRLEAHISFLPILSLWQVADLWTRGTEELDYIIFLNMLFRRITRSRARAGKRAPAWVKQAREAGQLASSRGGSENTPDREFRSADEVEPLQPPGESDGAGREGKCPSVTACAARLRPQTTSPLARRWHEHLRGGPPAAASPHQLRTLRRPASQQQLPVHSRGAVAEDASERAGGGLLAENFATATATARRQGTAKLKRSTSVSVVRAYAPSAAEPPEWLDASGRQMGRAAPRTSIRPPRRPVSVHSSHTLTRSRSAATVRSFGADVIAQRLPAAAAPQRRSQLLRASPPLADPSRSASGREEGDRRAKISRPAAVSRDLRDLKRSIARAQEADPAASEGPVERERRAGRGGGQGRRGVGLERGRYRLDPNLWVQV